MYCSPSRFENYSKHGSCYTAENVNIIRSEINTKEQKEKIPSKNAHAKIKEYFTEKCGNDIKNEYCWLDQLSFETRRKLDAAFRPKKPLSWNTSPRTWLNTDDINEVMIQYEKLHKDFKFLGVHPIDFAKYDGDHCISRNNLCAFHISAFTQKRFALVLNLDKHDEPGSHWVALYFNVDPTKNNFGIYYYDSTSYPPEDDVKEFMAKVQKQVKTRFPNLKKRFVNKHNTIQRQFKNTECGMFCIVFLTQCVKGLSRSLNIGDNTEIDFG